MDHTASLSDTADMTQLTANLKFHGDFLFDRIGRHNGFGRGRSAVFGQSVCQFVDMLGDRLQIQRLSDDTGGGNDHVVCRHTDRAGHQLAHGVCFFNAVGIAGVGNTAVANDRLRRTVCQMFFGDCQRCTFYQVGSVYRRRVSGHVTDDQRQVFFDTVLADAAMDTVCLITFCGTYAAGDQFHKLFLFLYIQTRCFIHTE